MRETHVTFTLEQVDEVVAKHLIPCLKTCRIFVFKGPLGAGKTTMIKSLLRQSGVTETVTSPTFSYVKQYEVDGGKVFYHFDLYRLTSPESFFSLGFDEYLNEQESVCLIEWPGVIEELLREPEMQRYVCWIDLSYPEDDLNRRIMRVCIE